MIRGILQQLNKTYDKCITELNSACDEHMQSIYQSVSLTKEQFGEDDLLYALAAPPSNTLKGKQLFTYLVDDPENKENSPSNLISSTKKLEFKKNLDSIKKKMHDSFSQTKQQDNFSHDQSNQQQQQQQPPHESRDGSQELLVEDSDNCLTTDLSSLPVQKSGKIESKNVIESDVKGIEGDREEEEEEDGDNDDDDHIHDSGEEEPRNEEELTQQIHHEVSEPLHSCTKTMGTDMASVKEYGNTDDGDDDDSLTGKKSQSTPSSVTSSPDLVHPPTPSLATSLREPVSEGIKISNLQERLKNLQEMTAKLKMRNAIDYSIPPTNSSKSLTKAPPPPPPPSKQSTASAPRHKYSTCSTVSTVSSASSKSNKNNNMNNGNRANYLHPSLLSGMGGHKKASTIKSLKQAELAKKEEERRALLKKQRKEMMENQKKMKNKPSVPVNQSSSTSIPDSSKSKGATTTMNRAAGSHQKKNKLFAQLASMNPSKVSSTSQVSDMTASSVVTTTSNTNMNHRGASAESSLSFVSCKSSIEELDPPTMEKLSQGQQQKQKLLSSSTSSERDEEATLSSSPILSSSPKLESSNSTVSPLSILSPASASAASSSSSSPPPSLSSPVHMNMMSAPSEESNVPAVSNMQDSGKSDSSVTQSIAPPVKVTTSQQISKQQAPASLPPKVLKVLAATATPKYSSSEDNDNEDDDTPLDTYELSDEYDSNDEDEDLARKRAHKHVPQWAKNKKLLSELIQKSEKIDPDLIFTEPIKTCNLSEVFSASRFRSRTSSAHWQQDHFTFLEEQQYKKEMGFQ